MTANGVSEVRVERVAGNEALEYVGSRTTVPGLCSARAVARPPMLGRQADREEEEKKGERAVAEPGHDGTSRQSQPTAIPHDQALL